MTESDEHVHLKEVWYQRLQNEYHCVKVEIEKGRDFGDEQHRYIPDVWGITQDGQEIIVEVGSISSKEKDERLSKYCEEHNGLYIKQPMDLYVLYGRSGNPINNIMLRRIPRNEGIHHKTEEELERARKRKRDNTTLISVFPWVSNRGEIVRREIVESKRVEIMLKTKETFNVWGPMEIESVNADKYYEGWSHIESGVRCYNRSA